MDEMTKNAALLAAIATFLAAIIALLSFIYTSYRQHKLEKSSMYQQLELASIDLFRWEIEHVKTILKMREKSKELSDEDKEIYGSRCFQTMNLFELCISSANAGTLPNKVFGSWLTWMYKFANEPGFAEMWLEEKTNYTPECREILDMAIKYPEDENKFTKDICDLKKYHLQFAEWKKDLAEKNA
ncbi:hypothetical protein FACS1894199_14390 [Bacteroidia bacterium]|nr:hypothetical protein FACS1894199_14390 [Bacteroidia bacterium]